jgi:phage host-nuclease inhibitor protein Gam
MPKTRNPEQPVATWEAVDEALARLCELDHDQAIQEAGMNQRMAEVRETYEEGLNEIASEQARLRANVEQFAREHQADFSPQKTIERLHGVLAFRTTPPAVKVLRRPWTDDERLAAVERQCGIACIRFRKELARDVVLFRFSSGKITAEDLAKAGLRISQHEEFNLELKRDATPAPQGEKS